MKSHFYAMLSRMKNIYRWGLMRNVKQESLGEHSLEVGFIAHALAIIENKRLGGSFNPDYVCTAALFHDTSEIITGDMPTPVKYYNKEIKSAYKQIEATAEESLLSLLPKDLRGEYLPLYRPDDKTRALIKAADKISALIKCIEEENMGNHEFASARKSTLKAIKDMKLKSADIFIKEYLGSYSLNLDELK